jgi:hypothetical protein
MAECHAYQYHAFSFTKVQFPLSYLQYMDEA